MSSTAATKPWKIYVKTLQGTLDKLLERAGPAPFTLQTISAWMASLTFIPLMSCDGDCKLLADFLPRGVDNPMLDFTRPDWQMILRIHFALDFCRGLVLKRKEFDWSQEPREIYCWLLITLWHENAFYWASRKFDTMAATATRRTGKLPEHFWLKGGTHPGKN